MQCDYTRTHVHKHIQTRTHTHTHTHTQDTKALVIVSKNQENRLGELVIRGRIQIIKTTAKIS